MVLVNNSTGKLTSKPRPLPACSDPKLNPGIRLMRTKPGLAAALCFAFTLSARAQDVSEGRWIDLTHPFNSETVYWPTAKTFEKETVNGGEILERLAE